MMDETAARAWCEALAKGLRHEPILRDGKPYLERYYVAGWNPITKQPGPAVYLHHFVASDAATQVHSHPWGWASSLILVGGYREYRCVGGRTTINEYVPGDVNVLAPTDTHRIELFAKDCWSLFMAGDYQQPWAFEAAC